MKADQFSLAKEAVVYMCAFWVYVATSCASKIHVHILVQTWLVFGNKIMTLNKLSYHAGRFKMLGKRLFYTILSFENLLLHVLY